MLWGLFGNANKVSNPDKFRIKVITLKNGTKKYYPQYKLDIISSDWENIIKTSKNNFVLCDLSIFELINGNHFCENQEDAINITNEYKLYLEQERAKEYQSEEIIKL